MAMNLIHDPNARLDYVWDWTDWLSVSETITNHAITVIPADEMVIDGDNADTHKVTAWVSGGVLGRTYQVTCHVSTSTGRADDRSFSLEVRDR